MTEAQDVVCPVDECVIWSKSPRSLQSARFKPAFFFDVFENGIMIRPFLTVLIPLLASSLCLSQNFTVTGVVRDSATGEPLPAANIRIDGTTRGTITNADGVFRLSLPPAPYTLIASFIGYRPDTLRVNLTRDVSVSAILAPIAIRLPEIVVTDEDPAYAIMRKVIENKSRWREGLHSYQFDAFTRQVIYRDTAIASIMESYTTGFWQKGDTLKEIVRQKRQTENIPFGQNFAGVYGIVNFYDDEIRFSGFTFVGPTSPETFEYYSFRLEETRREGDIEFYSIRMLPLSRVTPLFSGRLTVAGDRYALVAVDVEPNEAYRLPFVSDINLRYAQQFALLDTSFWMPVDIRLRGSAKVGFAGISIPPISFQQVSSIYDYRLNVPIPDSLADKPRRIQTKEAEVFDSTFWAQREVLPLTREEQLAYASLDSTQTLDVQFRPSGAVMTLGALDAAGLQFLDVRFNRAEGLYLGASVEADSVTDWLRISARAGYGFSDRRRKAALTAEAFLVKGRTLGVGAELHHDLVAFPDEGFYSPLTVLVSSLLYKIDQKDYYYRDGGSVFVTAKPLRLLKLQGFFRTERHQSAGRRTDFSLFSRSATYRPNPPVHEGSLKSLEFRLRFGPEPVPLGLVSQTFAEVRVEYSDASLGSDFSFTQGQFNAEFSLPTFLKRNLFPPTLLGRVSTGVGKGSPPPQRVFMLDGRSVGFGPFGLLKGSNHREFGGEGYVLLVLEHNFRSIPFLALNIPFLYENNIEVLLHGAVARTWSTGRAYLPGGTTTRGWYSEAGIGIGKIFGLLRVDCTRRLSDPTGFFLTVGISRIF